MEITRVLKNWLIINPVISFVFDRIRKTDFYHTLMLRTVRQNALEMKLSKEYNIGIETTNVCNAACVFCSYTVMERKKKVMDDSTFDLLIQRIKEDGIKPYGFSLNGTGEPLLDKKIFARIGRIKKEFPSSITKFHSNFALGTEKVIDDLLSSGLDEINISFNGYSRGNYEETMKIDYDKTRENLLLLIQKRNEKKSSLKIRISMALVARNEGDEQKFIDEWKPRADSVTINRAHDYSGAVEETAGKYKIDYHTKTLPCRALWAGITVGSDGQLLLCGLDYEANQNLGNIKDNSLLNLYYSDKMESIREAHLTGKLETYEKCAKCAVPYDHGLHWFVKRQI